MSDHDPPTCWTVIRSAARGEASDRQTFALRYEPVVRAYLLARWRGSTMVQEADDAVQEVFVECYRAGGALDRVDADRPGGFRAFLYGIARNVAMRHETRRGRRREEQPATEVMQQLPDASEARLSRVFDRAWATTIMREAAARQRDRARERGPAAERRVELLRLRFQEGIPIRVIAERWSENAAALHHEYARARREFREELVELVSFHHPGSAETVERACAELLSSLG